MRHTKRTFISLGLAGILAAGCFMSFPAPSMARRTTTAVWTGQIEAEETLELAKTADITTSLLTEDGQTVLLAPLTEERAVEIRIYENTDTDIKWAMVAESGDDSRVKAVLREGEVPEDSEYKIVYLDLTPVEPVQPETPPEEEPTTPPEEEPTTPPEEEPTTPPEEEPTTPPEEEPTTPPEEEPTTPPEEEPTTPPEEEPTTPPTEEPTVPVAMLMSYTMPVTDPEEVKEIQELVSDLPVTIEEDTTTDNTTQDILTEDNEDPTPDTEPPITDAETPEPEIPAVPTEEPVSVKVTLTYGEGEGEKILAATFIVPMTATEDAELVGQLAYCPSLYAPTIPLPLINGTEETTLSLNGEDFPAMTRYTIGEERTCILYDGGTITLPADARMMLDLSETVLNPKMTEAEDKAADVTLQAADTTYTVAYAKAPKLDEESNPLLLSVHGLDVPMDYHWGALSPQIVIEHLTYDEDNDLVWETIDEDQISRKENDDGEILLVAKDAAAGTYRITLTWTETYGEEAMTLYSLNTAFFVRYADAG